MPLDLAPETELLVRGKAPTLPPTPEKAPRPPVVRSEDWLAAWLGLAIIGLVLAGVRPDMPKFKWTTDGAVASTVAAQRAAVDGLVTGAAAAGERELATTAASLEAALESGSRAEIGASARELGATAKNVKDASLRRQGTEIAKSLGDAGASLGGVFSAKNLKASAIIGLAFLLVSAIGIALLGGKVGRYVLGFPVVYVLAWLSQVLAGNSTVSYWGLEYVIFALTIGLFISNVIGVPDWLREAVRTEYFIKTGLVILGASILFLEIRPGRRPRHLAGRARRDRRLVRLLLARQEAEGR